MKRSLALAGAAVAVFVAAGTPLHAQGSSVDQHSACMAARVGAGVAAPCSDASAIYFSPASIANNPGGITVGAVLIRAGNTFTYDANQQFSGQTIERETESKIVPHIFASMHLNPRLAAGIGVFAPYGLGLEWPVCSAETVNTESCDQSQNFEGRYTGYDNALRGVYVQPTVAYQLIPNRLSVGAGLDYVMGSIEVHQRSAGPSSLGLQNRDVADVTLEGNGTGVGFHLSAVAQLTPRTSIGARYLSAVEVDMDGDAGFEQISTGFAPFDAAIAAQLPSDQAVATSIEFPAQLVLGVSFRPFETLNLLADFQRTHWSSFDEFEIDFETAANDTLRLNYEDTNTFRFAADLAATEKLAVRLGYRYNTAATPRATPFLPEGERNYYTFGLGYSVTPRLNADFAFQHINQPARAGAVRPEAPRAGVYESRGQVFGFTLSYRLGGQ
jgi:long-chain fatty acid transport protein